MRKNSRQNPDASAANLLICDVTQSWSEVGGGVGTYLRHKRRHILDNTDHRHLLIVPGSADTVTDDGRAVTVTIRSPHVPGSPNYRLMLRNGQVKRVLERFRECRSGNRVAPPEEQRAFGGTGGG